MKKTLIISLLAALAAVSYTSAQTIDAPHNASNAIVCADCHDQFPDGNSSDAACLSCHTNATGGGYTKNTAPRMATHSSENTTDKYGSWTVRCITCHHRHVQEQTATYGPAAYLVTGIISSVTDNGDGTTTFGYMNPVENITGWADYTKWSRKSDQNASGGNERGLILFPNTANLGVSFELVSATATAITVKGSIDTAFPGTVAPGSTFALSYGQNMNAGVVPPSGIAAPVKFFQNSSVNSFAYTGSGSPDTNPDGICQVCHTKTSFWKADGSVADHFNGTNCTRCHKHEEGFKTSCDGCHTAPPATGAHVAHFDSAVPQYGTTKIQSTPAAYAFSCGICHQGTHLNTAADPRTTEVAFGGVAVQDGASTAAYAPATPSVDDPGKGYTFNYSDGTCSNTYCHGNYPGGRAASVTFNTGSAPCGSCHAASNIDPPVNGSHPKHAASTGHNYSCALCHEGMVSKSGAGYLVTDKSKHVSGMVDWKFDLTDPRVSAATSYSIPAGTAVPSDGFNPRQYGTCSNTYCHSIAQTATGGPLTGAPGEYAKTPSWSRETGSNFCGYCHKNGTHHNSGLPSTMDSGSHTKHLSYQFNTLTNSGMKSYKCAICHHYEPQASVSYNTCDSCHLSPNLYTLHSDGKVDVIFDAAFGNITYNDYTVSPGLAGNGFFNCSNSYCHSSGTSVSTGSIPANTSAVWGSGALTCAACHGNPPSYANGTPKKNSHPAHAGETCNKCHVTVTANGTTIASTSLHVNKAYNVMPETASGVTFTYTYSAAGGSCTNISCHGGNSAQWGAAVRCQDCHFGTTDVDDFAGIFYNNGAASKIKNTGEWDTTGHGRSGSYASGNPGASFTSSNACLYCHDNGVTHKAASNPFRLRGIGDASWGKNGVCQNCHGVGSAGIIVDGVLRNGTKKIGSTHYGSKHSVSGSGGQFCWDCHDPHGDGNIFMVHASVAKASDGVTGAPSSTVATIFTSFGSGTDYAKSSAPFSGVCNVCHTSTNHYTATSGDGHNEATRCTNCHAHSGTAPNNAFSASCGGCHGDPPASATYGDGGMVGTGLNSGDTGATDPLSAGGHVKHASVKKMGCDTCHKGTDMQTRTDGKTIDIGFSISSATFPGFVGSAATGTFFGADSLRNGFSWNASSPGTVIVQVPDYNNTCAVYCHGAGTTDKPALTGGVNQAPSWVGGSSQAVCGTCHGGTDYMSSAGNPPTTGAHLKHAGSAQLGLACIACHASTTDMTHVNGVVSWSLGTNDARFGNFSAYNGLAAGSTGTLAPSAVYAGCSNIYCHSIVQKSDGSSLAPNTADYKQPNWGNDVGTLTCSSCHGYPSNSGAHLKHAGAASGQYAFTCADCHTGQVPPAVARHADGSVDTAIAPAWGTAAVYQGDRVPGNGFSTCANTYCHSSGIGGTLNTGETRSIPGNTSITWNGSATCSACHGQGGDGSGRPNYANNDPSLQNKKNSHLAPKHALLSCDKCHAATTSDGLSIPDDKRQNHVNRLYNVTATGTAPSTFSYTYSVNGGSCSASYCHSNVQDNNGGAGTVFNTAAWGDGDAGNCAARCHTNAPQTGTHPRHLAQSGIGCDSCHKDAGSGTAKHADYRIDLSMASGVYSQGSHTPGSGSYGTCSATYCHGSGNPVWGGTLAESCDSCHSGQGAGTAVVKNHTPAHGGKHTQAYALGCENCHSQLRSDGAGRINHAGGKLTDQQAAEVLFTDQSGTIQYGNGATMRFVSLFANPYGTASAPTPTYVSGLAAGTDPLNAGLSWTAGSCGTVWCHSNASPYLGTNLYTAPVWTGAYTGCNECHSRPADAARTWSQPHDKHLVAYGANTNFTCNACHAATALDNVTVATGIASEHVNGRKDIAWNTFANSSAPAYDAAAHQCQNVYCHGNGTTATPVNVSATWSAGTLPADCTGCHGGDSASAAPLMSGSHAKHVSAGLDCSKCHSATASERTITSVQNHVNKLVNVAFDAAANPAGTATYAGALSPMTKAPGTSAGSCSSVYCHSSGVSIRTGVLSADATAAWGSGPLACNGCHGNTAYSAPNDGMPNYPNGNPKENSHQAHVLSASIACASCHADTTGTGTSIANAAFHANGLLDSRPSGTYGGQVVDFVYSSATTTRAGSCSSISCHGGNGAAWGETLNCQDCHLGGMDAENFSGIFWNNGTAGLISRSEWTATGHGRTAASGSYASGNAPADFAASNACLYCHDGSVGHKADANPFRLKNLADPTWGKNGACQICHASGSSGVTVGGVLRNGSNKIGSAHYGSKHSAAADGGQFCWDCHDPHGDSNIFMVHASVAKTSDAASGAPTSIVATVFTSFATGTDYAKSAAPYDGVCNVCHSTTSHYTAASGDGHNASVRCTQCHNHAEGFKPNGDSCSDCHSSAGGPAAGTAPDAYHAKHVQTAYAGKVSLGDYGNYTTNQWYRYANIGGRPDSGCGYCHPQSASSHMNGAINLNFDRNDAGAAGTLKAKNAVVQAFSQNSRVSVTCSSVYCHADGYLNESSYGYRTTPDWYGGVYAGDKCAGCHGNSPTGSVAHAAHVVGIHYKTIYTGTTGLASAGNSSTSSHGYADANGTALTSTTINCNICHYSTVTAAGNDYNTVCATCHTGTSVKGVMTIAGGSTTHVNGMVDIAFSPVAIRTRAQVRDDITTVQELNDNWTRMNGYKQPGSYDAAKTSPSYSAGTCSVACHNGYPVAWNSTVTCDSCHTDLPRRAQ